MSERASGTRPRARRHIAASLAESAADEQPTAVSGQREPSPPHVSDESPPRQAHESIIEETDEDADHEPSPAIASEPEPHLRGEGRDDADS